MARKLIAVSYYNELIYVYTNEVRPSLNSSGLMLRHELYTTNIDDLEYSMGVL